MSEHHQGPSSEGNVPQSAHSGRFVCAQCLEDQALQDFANFRGETRECNYCGQTPMTASVVPLDDVIKEMRKAIAEEWCDPEESDVPPLGSADGGGNLVDSIEYDVLFYEIGFEVSSRKLMADISKSFSDHEWCPRCWELLSPSKRWGFGWDRFQHVVKHQRRYTFWYSRDDLEDASHPDFLPPANMLGEIGAVINSMQLVKEFPVGTVAWRLQPHSKGEVLLAPDRYTSPPIECAKQPNRMSPPGVPMFYGADDFQTALLEVHDPEGKNLENKAVSGVQFRSVLPLNLLDLTTIPAPPSYFSPDGPSRRHYIKFLNKFVKDLSLPIEREERQHIEYVPTQVFTEFVRHIMKGPNGVPIHGIRYASSKDGKSCYVIFATQEECLKCGPLGMVAQKLEYVEGSIKTVDAMEVSCIFIGDLLAELETKLVEKEK